ncbi:cyclase family protein [Nocardia seriolae]|uniref:Cyclase n=1 Tax=Nocardia seriolae TaxID=37332 RepID=A0A0B8ND99_9NOCA|nr:cyclase family protein [Nocardia seriolae]APB01095.1 hypothetical protein NS506_07068 [Nocardia seriolae]MTJ65617.1 cyclase family protein [Nocardia seriolae]MTJ72736.1 cyclase family protein [Nocardia seriolae]MTJ90494.1 cyclase family protein [Nocardia seriolae]MTK34454.1 cyclase family protein [Nocardia seriolae]
MTAVTALLAALADGSTEIIDLTAPLHSGTPILQLPPPFSNTVPFGLEEISHYDDRGPGWYWNNIHTGEHTGTHLDVPIHWVTGQGGFDVHGTPLRGLIAPAVVVDVSARVTGNPDFLLEVDDLLEWQKQHGPLPDGGWVLLRTGWDAYADDAARFRNADATGPHSPGLSADCAEWLSQQTIFGLGVETVGTDAGTAHGFEPPFPCHHFLLGAGKCGLTQLRNLSRLPTTGFGLIVSPLPIKGGTGSPTRVLALVDR